MWTIWGKTMVTHDEDAPVFIQQMEEAAQITVSLAIYTKAVATRGGHIYINLKGRNPHGIVDPADKYQVEEELIKALYQYEYQGKRAISQSRVMRTPPMAAMVAAKSTCWIIRFTVAPFLKLRKVHRFLWFLESFIVVIIKVTIYKSDWISSG